MRRSLILGCAACLVAWLVPSMAADAPAGAAPAAAAPAAPQRRTTMLGSSEHQFYLAKISVSDLPRSFDFYTREAVARATAAGYPSTRGEPGDGPMSFGFVRDPDGYNIEFIQAPPYPAH